MLKKPGENLQKYRKTTKNLKTGKKQKNIQKPTKISKNFQKRRKNLVKTFKNFLKLSKMS